VLKSMKYRDTSKIVTFYSKEYGKLKGIAKGARSAKNKFGSSLEPLTQSMLVLYKKEYRDLHLISQCDALCSFKNLSEDFERMTAALSVIELVHQVTHEEERNPALFTLIVETLNALNGSIKNYSTFVHAFQVRLASLFGYEPNFETCGECETSMLAGTGDMEFSFMIARGAVYCNRCRKPDDLLKGMEDPGGTYCSITAEVLQILRRLKTAPINTLGNLEFNRQAGNQIDEVLRLYLRYHFDGLKSLKSTELFQYK
jgi:DNA repair protein RecO (recombination protein O)